MASHFNTLEERRARVSRLFVLPLMVYSWIPAVLGAGTVAFFVERGTVPEERSGWPYLIRISTSTLSAGLFVGIVGVVVLTRRILKNRTCRHGREKAVMEFVSESDSSPSIVRRTWLRCLGIKNEDLKLVRKATAIPPNASSRRNNESWPK